MVVQLNSSKTLGPDGFNGEFYKSFWPIIKNDITLYLELLRGSVNIAQINKIYIAPFRPLMQS